MTVSVLIADDQALVRTGFRMILETDPEIRVVAEAGDGTQAVEASKRTRPDIALMDIRMPVMDGLEATRQLARVLDKLSLRDRIQAVVLAYETGIVRPGSEQPHIT